jgi:hypothetical protein
VTTEIVSSSVEVDAYEFGVHISQGGWRLGLLVARSVERGVGDPSLPDAGRSPRVEGKVSMNEFARMALGNENAKNRVRRYYNAWERAAAKGKVPHADDLEVGAEPDINWEHLPPWRSFFADPSKLTGGATGPLNLTVHLGYYGDRLLKANKRFLHFVEKELPGKKPGKQSREMAGRYADSLEAQAKVLRRIEAGDTIDTAESKQSLDPAQFFSVR